MSTVRPAKQKKPTGGAAQMQPDRANAEGAPCCLEVPKAPMAKVTEPCGCTTASAWAWRWNDEETTGLSAGREVADACREYQLTRRRARVAIATLDPD